MPYSSRKPTGAPTTSIERSANWIAMSIAWLGLALKMGVESAIRSCLRPATTTILDIPAGSSQSPPIGSKRNALLAIGEPANDFSAPAPHQPKPVAGPAGAVDVRHPEPRP